MITQPSAPTSLADITPEWMSEALRAEVADVGVTQIAIGEGFTSHIARVTLTGREVPASVIVKIPSPDPGAQALGQMLQLFEREHRFYAEIAPTIDVRVPRCHLALDGGEGRYVLVLEDVGHLETPDQLEGTSRVRAEQAIDWLSSFHARTWDLRDDRWPWVPRPEHPMNQGIQPLAAANLPMFFDAYADTIGTRREIVEQGVEHMPELLENRDYPFNVGHGDFRLDNMRFDGDEIVVFDWQIILATSGLYDVMYFLTTSLTTEQRRGWQDDLLRRYQEGICAKAGADFSMQDVNDGFRLMMRFYCGVLPVVSTLDFGVNERADHLARAIIDRVLTAAEDLGIG